MPTPSTRRATTALLTAVTGLVALAGPASTSATAAPAAAAALPAVPAAPAAGTVPVSSTCRTAVTVVRPDGSLALGAVTGARARLYPMGVTVGFAPTAVAYLGTSQNAGVAIDRHYAIDAAGRLHLLTVTDRRAARGGVRLADEVVGTGWSQIRALTYGGPYLYGLTTTGGLKRYVVGATRRPTSAGTVATRGFGGVRSLGFGGWWHLPGGKAGDDLLGTTTSGALNAYTVRRDAPSRVSVARLGAAGWGAVAHLAVGQCARGTARPLVGITSGGDVRVYLDANGNDQSGKDIRYAGRAATGWTGVVAD